MADSKAKRVQVATTVEAGVAEALSEIRWARKIDKFSDVIREAVTEYVERHGKIEGAVNGK